ncbi:MULTISPECIES: hypothetical protein [Pseudomonas]|uniref:CdiI immunity protein domain-containing protein n=1 Tax=Pseudomonas antarctica TaxID=219572 RepID=A0A1H0BMY8_9PSED|nr:hypothetical protein [Pseudomonas antarctica]KAF2406550.1 hypothetical protein PSAN_47260 [Pseudomonas antarctica]SDN47006.1 hypothetical protein SAMN04490179_4386 [Pseudomonas antarctica]
MLKDPFLNEPFDPNLKWLIGVFDVYDREHELGKELEKYNPNEKLSREVLIRNHALNLDYLSYRHKFALIQALKSSLDAENYDFQSLFTIGEDEAASWPRAEWYELESPRDFLNDVYQLAQIIWKDDLQKASLEDQSTW